MKKSFSLSRICKTKLEKNGPGSVQGGQGEKITFLFPPNFVAVWAAFVLADSSAESEVEVFLEPDVVSSGVPK